LRAEWKVVRRVSGVGEVITAGMVIREMEARVPEVKAERRGARDRRRGEKAELGGREGVWEVDIAMKSVRGMCRSSCVGVGGWRGWLG